MSPFWVPEPRMSLRLLVCWLYAWLRGTRSWTRGSTSCWGRLFSGKSSCCFTAVVARNFTPSIGGSAVCSTAQRRPAAPVGHLIAAASVKHLCMMLSSNPSPEPCPESFYLRTPRCWKTKGKKIIWNTRRTFLKNAYPKVNFKVTQVQNKIPLILPLHALFLFAKFHPISAPADE